MNITKPTDFSKNVTKFLGDFLPFQRNFSINTIYSYRDTLKLFLIYVEKKLNIKIEKFSMKSFNKETIINFLKNIRMSCSISTSNQRLAAIKSFSKFCQAENPELLLQLQEIISIKHTKGPNKVVGYLDVDVMKTLINSPNSNTLIGLKHKLILALLYDTGARVQELCDIKIKDIHFGEITTIKLHGKGNKTRIVPIDNSTSTLIQKYQKKCNLNQRFDDFLITNKFKTKMNRDGIEYVINKYAQIVKKTSPTPIPDKIHPHMFRHSKAVHMVEANIPIVYIRDFLGHSDISTTMIYATINNKLKLNAINNLAPKLIDNSKDEPKDWNYDKDLMNFLENL